MIYTFNGSELNAYFGLSTDYARERDQLTKEQGLIHILWNRSNRASTVLVDNTPIVLQPNQLTTSTYLQKVAFEKGSSPIAAFSFNREFYCINTHDHEVSCNGIIFFGTQSIPIITLRDDEIDKFEMLYRVFVDEFTTRDNIQGEMLQMLLKRLIIKITRLARTQLITKELDNNQIEIVRKFNVLVETHFKTKKQVADYADLLFKSPKTLSNLFAKFNQKSPLSIIHERIVLEAKRQLLYTDKTTKEIAHELGFDEVSSFHKLFKKITSMAPQRFKHEAKNITIGKNEQLVGKS
ncbi:MAG: helix-turn-helix domain-containing protein [Imperialibacter sp.]|uniref:helix-turn-helix domain-containing protein n=1 Tax=Imperialibacter sp. TaxID=2038411 RepID=UPI0032ED0191